MNKNILYTAFESLFEKARVRTKIEDKKEIKIDERSIGQQLYNDMLDYFNELIVHRSVGKRMVFHMGFIIWIKPSAYKSIKEELILIVPEIIDGFYDIIQEKLKFYPKCLPPSTDWFFQFTPTDIIPTNEANGNLNEIVNMDKDYSISSTFHSPNHIGSNVKLLPNTVLSFRPVNSNTFKDVDINKDLLLGIESIQGAIWKHFEESKCGLTINRDDIYSINGYATLKYNIGGIDAFSIVTDKHFFVSGPADGRKQSNVLILQDESVIVGHLAFRYSEKEDCFEVAAYGHTVLNDRVLKISTRDEPVWYRVAAKSSFLLGDGVGIEYVQNKIKDVK